MIFDRKVFREIIQRLFPNIKDGQIQIFDDGWDYVVFVIEGQKAVRFPRRPDYAKKLPVEVAFLNHFGGQFPVSVPKLTLHADKKTCLPYVTYDFIPGVQFKKNVSDTFSKEELRLIASRIGNFLEKLHSLSVNKVKKLGVRQVESLKTWRNKFEKIKTNVFPHISRPEQNWATSIFQNFFTIVQESPIPLTVIHSDIMPEHIIVNPKTHTLSGIIDFGDIEIGDPAYDFAFLAKYGKNFLEWTYENYKQPRDNAFEIRRQFYLDRLVLTNLEHSIEIKNQTMIKRHKAELGAYISRNEG
ncbi:aminoglycoside phosphotransferase family protein [Candidatus Collierbacteria bacterium]|nr:aminoglycoside phosphotransferase family protein [Candidatus Collierbacteria bacterium]